MFDGSLLQRTRRILLFWSPLKHCESASTGMLKGRFITERDVIFSTVAGLL